MAMVEKASKGEKALVAGNYLILGALTVMFLYPIWHCLMASFSDPISLIGFKGLLLKPIGFSLEGYTTVLKNQNVYIGYGNTIFYVLVGTVINMVLTVIAGYCLSRKGSMFMRPLTMLLLFTMYVNFGLIPAFLNIKNLGLLESRWAILLPGAMSTYSAIVMRTAVNAVPRSLEESAQIDGANDFVVLWKIIVPCTKATLAVLMLGYVVGHWNSWFSAAIYLQDRDTWPLQLFLREILIANTSATGEANSVDGVLYLDELLKYCTIIISTAPILCLYPFVQKYFVTGMMMGSVKG